MSQQDIDNYERLKREGKTPIATSLGDKLKAAGVGEEPEDELDRILAEKGPQECPNCGALSTELRNDGASGYCLGCSASWANYITIKLTIDKDGELADEAQSTA